LDPVATSHDAYVSFNINAADLSTDFDWNPPRLASLAAHLAPALLRIGGGAEKNVECDDAFFDGPWQGVVSLAEALQPFGVDLVWSTNPNMTKLQSCLLGQTLQS
jgi:hypothetical protein